MVTSSSNNSGFTSSKCATVGQLDCYISNRTLGYSHIIIINIHTLFTLRYTDIEQMHWKNHRLSNKRFQTNININFSVKVHFIIYKT